MWPHLLCTAIGAWLMAAPQVLSYGEPARTNDHIVGPLLFTFGCTAMFQSVRGVRWVNVPIGAWLVAAPLFLGYRGNAMVNDIVAGFSTIILASIRGEIRQQFGGGWRILLQSRRR